ncbi:hypothetical protein AVEN_199696-1 [Araneus ventricosus]|uniref:Uncharacterized protein n=1 Tax=Araneus ventricosus TaxID=182803 RepID=A0A4Y2KK97_ARAVE|nr:hypothetical protein AVEN_199696-1 [Araneus ventricosus]
MVDLQWNGISSLEPSGSETETLPLGYRGSNQSKENEFVKAMDKTGDGFNFLKTKFPRLSEAKIKEGIFVGPQITQLFKDSTLMKHLNRKEKRA